MVKIWLNVETIKLEDIRCRSNNNKHTIKDIKRTKR